MNATDPTLWLGIGIAIGITSREIAKRILNRLDQRTDHVANAPRKIIVVLEREALDRVAESVSNTVLDATQRHIDALKKPGKN